MGPCPDLPRHYVISPPAQHDTRDTVGWSDQWLGFLQAMEQVCKQDDRMVLLRHVPGMAQGDDRLLVACLAVAKRHQVMCFLHDDAHKAHALGFAGVHWSAARLRCRQRVAGLLQLASCHSSQELELAAAQEVDGVVLSPVRPTTSHPGRPPLGWDGFTHLAAQATVPAYALGGVGPHDLNAAQRCGGHGVAGISAFWPTFQAAKE